MARQWQHDKPIFIRKLIDRVENLGSGECLSFFTNSLDSRISRWSDTDYRKPTDDKYYIEEHAPLLEYASRCVQDASLCLQPLHDAIIHELLYDYHSDGINKYQVQNVLELIIHDTQYELPIWKKLLWDWDYAERFDELDTVAHDL